MTNRTMLRLAAAMLLSTLAVTGCARERKGPLERAGERIDDAVDEAREGDNPFKRKGPLERTGESIDRALDNDRR